MNSKKVFNPKSKTHWLGALTTTVGALFIFVPQLMPHMPPEYYGYAFGGLGVANIILRSITNTAITDK